MATFTHTSLARHLDTPLELWHLLSLDAPTVAVLWTWFVARANHAELPATVFAAMFLAVWVLYAADRMLDFRAARSHRISADDLAPRHFFHYRHRRLFLGGIALASSTVVPLLFASPRTLVLIYLAEAATLVLWLLLLHLTRNPHLPKELIVGVFFAAAAFTPVLARRVRNPESILFSATLFAALCTLNCLFIHFWEIESNRLGPLLISSAVLAVIALARAPYSLSCLAISMSAALLLVLNRYRHRMSRTHLRAAADAVLLTPALLLPFVR